MDGRRDAAGRGVVDAVPWAVMRVANHDVNKRVFAEFPRLHVGHFGEDNAPEDAEFKGVRGVDVSRVSGTPPERPTVRL
jgi:hypothetical protein